MLFEIRVKFLQNIGNFINVNLSTGKIISIRIADKLSEL